jgi:2-methylcitrate dehydratase
VGKCAIEALDRAMRGETSPSPVYEGDYGILATLLDGPDALYRVTLPSAGETPRGILATYTKEHSAGYHGQAIIDLAFRMRLRIEDTNTIERVDIYSKRPTHVVMGSGSGDPHKYDPAASRETLDHSAMYIFAVALEDGEWHHERSYAPERRRRPETLALWRKVTTHEDEEWNRRYYDEPDSLKKDQGARIEITLAGGEKVVDELSVGNAHPRGATPFQRPDYISKFDTLTESIVSRNEAERFLGVVDRLARLDGDELAGLNVAADAISLSHAVRNREGIF